MSSASVQERDTEPTYWITLVHGTFSNSSIWTEAFTGQLAKALGGTVHFETFDWSGKNSQLARLEAARELQKKLLSTQQQHPEAVQFTVGHSHGGNVALYAIRHPNVRRAVRGVVCLGTPFLAVRARALWITAGFIVLGLAATVGAIVINLIARGMLLYALWEEEYQVTDGTSFFVKLVAGLVLIVVVLNVLKALVVNSPAIFKAIFAVSFGYPAKFLTRRQNRVLARYPKLRLEGIPMFYAFFEKKDSAHRWLRIWALLADSPRLVLAWVLLPCLLVANAVLILLLFRQRSRNQNCAPKWLRISGDCTDTSMR
jgi:pimeloyl-ACP methyl ester carboxylesterase